ncbi:MAG: MFS transporter [Nitrospirota bacterium]|nr:MFS transporter [Nitrospirota bacterium]MDH5767383.1 MFS transporter [Nitrospirota bacterium]
MKSVQNSSYSNNNQKRIAYQFIILLGIVSLFGDITYEGARSVTGPYLAVLGASASIVGLVAGLGEFLGYGLRLVSGYFADRTKAYWSLTIIGYGLILSIPLLAFAGYWQVAAFLIILERIGKAIRTPARDAMLSHATLQVGRGWGFALHEAIDQIGAIIGPLIFSAVFLFKGGYREGFAILWIPAFLTLSILVVARIKVPLPERLETFSEGTEPDIKGKKRLQKVFWFYALFIFLSVAGFSNFQIISYHFKVQSIVSDIQIPIFYAIAMGVDVLVALIIGKTYDKIGLKSLIIIPLLTLPIPFFAFSYNYSLALISVVLWGAVMGIHETIMRAAIADLSSVERRGFAYGIFNTIYGAAWFLGSTFMGLLYDISISYIIIFVIFMELISIPVFFFVKKERIE